jgi:hypothetical protein
MFHLRRKPKPHTVVRADRPGETFATFAAGEFTDAEVLSQVEREAYENALTLLVYHGGRYVGTSQAWGEAGCIA